MSPSDEEEFDFSLIADDNSEEISTQERKRCIRAEMGPAQIWVLEKRLGAPWLAEAEKVQRIIDKKAGKKIAAKRIALYAKQVCEGLQTTYSLSFDSNELIPILLEAEKELEKKKPQKSKVQLLRAVERFDLKFVANALGVAEKFKRETPSLSIQLNKPILPKLLLD